MRASLILLLLIVGVSGVYSGHSLHFYETTVSVPGHGLQLFSEVGYVDGIEITRYSSDVGQAVPVAPWMKKVEDLDYWERQTQRCKVNEADSKYEVKVLMNRYNQTTGFHYYQFMCGCELRDDGSIRVYDQLGFDMKDFISLDTERGVYYPLTDQAQATTQKWNSPEVRAGERWKYYLETDCIDWLKKYIEYGKEELERRGGCRVWRRVWRGEVGAGCGEGSGEERWVQGVENGLERRGGCRVWRRGWRGEVGAGCGEGAGEERWVQGVENGLERRGGCRVWRMGWRGEVGAGCGEWAGEE
uniref:MHC class I-like antigen recognition-like domain-containing protein n=1 Tax=Leptobrachium leishanense TaxID=445787 RepID=A0A8C5MP28_9ANUR